MNKMIVPKTISVGFQNRSDTYTKKLAYVIYTDAKGILRKAKSWNSWKDDRIPTEVFDNEPTSGFVLNKKVGDYKSDWNHRSAAVRIYDPRGFEFEISVENLLFILQECSSVKGKGLEGDFVYAWDSTELVLLPTTSTEYQQSTNFTSLQTKKITKTDIKEGLVYVNKDNDKVIYLGRFDWTVSDYDSVYGQDHYGHRDYNNHTTIYKLKTTKKHVFRYLDKKELWVQDGFTKLATIDSPDVSPLFAEYFDDLKKNCKHLGKEFELKKVLRDCRREIRQDHFYGFTFRVEGKTYNVNYNYKNGENREYYIEEYSHQDSEYDVNEVDLICTITYNRKTDRYGYNSSSNTRRIITLNEINTLIEEKIVFKNLNNDCILREI